MRQLITILILCGLNAMMTVQLIRGISAMDSATKTMERQTSTLKLQDETIIKQDEAIKRMRSVMESQQELIEKLTIKLEAAR